MRSRLLLMVGIVGWLPACTAGFVDVPARNNFPAVSAQAISSTDTTRMAPMRDEGKGRTKVRCAECGLVVSLREIAGNDGDFLHAAAGGITAGSQNESQIKVSRSYEMTIRMADGSSRVIRHEGPANWRSGERVILIAGANPAAGRKVQSWAR